ncbi:Starch-binding associating with outer membrane [Filimonas lacunae]|uniref:Starch-binding associating with outer membrane n=2 Tax=Filimonas lacunae TaxID=477680 RepID=A0A173MAF9_9BACT|nr:RagB/SusD domain protein [Filimonas lacunae]SIT31758.1 Starch-binding associating with outer membrane [Filimonas lacunae]
MALAGVVLLASCSKSLDPGIPNGSIGGDAVFTSDNSATSAVMAIYSYSYTYEFLKAQTIQTGLSSDELMYTMSSATTDAAYAEFSVNNLTVGNTVLLPHWKNAYYVMAQINLAIDGVTNSTGITASTKSLLLGELKFWRAYIYFSMYNTFGPVPLIVSAGANDAETNKYMPRTDSATMFKQIFADLTEAQSLLPVAYTGTLRGRVNKAVASALLARLYLYQKDYANAEAQAASVIGQTSTYSFMKDLTKVFKNASTETIWQIPSYYGYSTVGYNYVTLTTTTLPPWYLNKAVYSSFDTADLRKANWTSYVVNGTDTLRTITKYKLPSSTTAGDEATVMMRLPEQYLIRAEARLKQGNTSGATSDLDSVRVRAGLALLSESLTADQLMDEVMLQRKLELFGEQGHRWFDLKRTNRAISELGASRPALVSKPGHLLFPIPDNQRSLNTNLTQNNDY